MNVHDDDSKCCLCGNPDVQIDVDPYRHNLRTYRCQKSCGTFLIDDEHVSMWQGDASLSTRCPREKVAVLTLEHSIRFPRNPLFLQLDERTIVPGVNAYPVTLSELIESRWPATVPERIDRALCNLARKYPGPGQIFPRPLTGNQKLLFAINGPEASFFDNALTRFEYVEVSGPRDKHCLTSRGWERFAELERQTSSPEHPVFVAMWYGDESTSREMDALYEKAIEPALRDAGYHVTRADIEPHNDFIMNQVLGDIRVAPFVVADFTGNRHGVYFEAGFARGLGIPVIHTCKKSAFENAHFDTKQLLHLLWDEPGELREKLLQHIRGSIGEGPYNESGRD